MSERFYSTKFDFCPAKTKYVLFVWFNPHFPFVFVFIHFIESHHFLLAWSQPVDHSLGTTDLYYYWSIQKPKWSIKRHQINESKPSCKSWTNVVFSGPVTCDQMCFRWTGNETGCGPAAFFCPMTNFISPIVSAASLRWVTPVGSFHCKIFTCKKKLFIFILSHCFCLQHVPNKWTNNINKVVCVVFDCKIFLT